MRSTTIAGIATSILAAGIAATLHLATAPMSQTSDHAHHPFTSASAWPADSHTSPSSPAHTRL